MPDSIAAAKAELRRRARSRRRDLRESAPTAGEGIAANFLTIPIAAPAAIAAYAPIGSEADPTILVERLRQGGHALALPRIWSEGEALRFHLWPLGADLLKGRFGLLEPAPDWPEIVPDVLLVPLLAFDAAGHRLGYGGGYYDRTLRELRRRGSVLAAGVGFAGQEENELPADENDERLDWIVTEKSARKF